MRFVWYLTFHAVGVESSRAFIGPLAGMAWHAVWLCEHDFRFVYSWLCIVERGELLKLLISIKIIEIFIH